MGILPQFVNEAGGALSDDGIIPSPMILLLEI